MSAEEPTTPAGPRKDPTEYIRTQEEIEICNLLVELQSYMPPLVVIIPFVDQLAEGKKAALNKWARPFVGNPERISWLRDFVLDAKKKIEESLPTGTGIDVLTDKNAPSSNPKFTKWQFFQNSYPQASSAIFNASRKISKAFSVEFKSYEK